MVEHEDCKLYINKYNFKIKRDFKLYAYTKEGKWYKLILSIIPQLNSMREFSIIKEELSEGPPNINTLKEIAGTTENQIQIEQVGSGTRLIDTSLNNEYNFIIKDTSTIFSTLLQKNKVVDKNKVCSSVLSSLEKIKKNPYVLYKITSDTEYEEDFILYSEKYDVYYKFEDVMFTSQGTEYISRLLQDVVKTSKIEAVIAEDGLQEKVKQILNYSQSINIGDILVKISKPIIRHLSILQDDKSFTVSIDRIPKDFMLNFYSSYIIRGTIIESKITDINLLGKRGGADQSIDLGIEFYYNIEDKLSSEMAIIVPQSVYNTIKSQIEELFNDKKEAVKEDIKKVSKIIQGIYPDKWEISDIIADKIKYTVDYYITIHFPEIEITNSRNESEVIYDLYVRFLVKEGSYILGIHGFRTTYTNQQIKKNYCHSHINGVPNSGFSSFCIGQADIRDVLSMTLEDKNKLLGEKEDILEYLLLQLEVYLSWESIEGTPYNYINEIAEDEIIRYIKNLGQPLNVGNLTVKSLLKTHIADFQKYINLTQLNIDGFNIYKLSNNKDLELCIGSLIPTEFKCCKSNNGEYFNYRNTSSDTRTVDIHPSFTFKGIEYNEITIINKKSENNESSERIWPQPAVYEAFQQAINEELQLFQSKQLLCTEEAS